MASRISRHDIEVQLRNLNRALERPEEPYTRADGVYHANAGCLHLSGAYGGWQVQEMMAGGGTREITRSYAPLREVSVFLDGMSAALAALCPRDAYGRVTSWDCVYRAIPRT